VTSDGRYVAAKTKDGKAYLFPVAGGEPILLSGLHPGDWITGAAADPNVLYGVHAEPMRADAEIFRYDVAGARRESLRKIELGDPGGVIGFGTARVAADGRSYAYSYTQVLSDLYLVSGLR
jgi:hypothetical protein